MSLSTAGLVSHNSCALSSLFVTHPKTRLRELLGTVRCSRAASADVTLGDKMHYAIALVIRQGFL